MALINVQKDYTILQGTVYGLATAIGFTIAMVLIDVYKRQQYIYAVILGLLTGVFRIFGNSAEGVSYAIIFTNLLVPLIERVTVPVGFGRGGKKKA